MLAGAVADRPLLIKDTRDQHLPDILTATALCYNETKTKG